MQRFKSAVLWIAFYAAASNAAATDAHSVHVRVALSQAAQAMLGGAGEHVTVASYWYGVPKAAFSSKADEVGQIQAVSRTDGLTARGGHLVLDPGHADSAAWGWIEGPVSINVNVYSARKRFDDNVLACDFIDGVASEISGEVTLECALITENVPTRHLPLPGPTQE